MTLMIGSLAIPMNAAFFVILGVVLVIAVVLAVTLWKVFTKMGLPGVFGLIPVFNLYLLFKKCWGTRGFFAVLGCSIALLLFHVPTILTAIGLKFQYPWFGEMLILDPGPKFRVLLIMFGIAFAIVALVVMFGLCVEMAMKFQLKGKFGIGLFFLPFVFGPMLAFGKTTYKEKEEEAVYVALDAMPEK